MLRSMTGYGQGEGEEKGWKYSVQVKSVNNRFLELPLKLPSALWSKDSEARALFQKTLTRGKLDLNWKETRPEKEAQGLAVNLELASSYLRSLEKLAEGL